MIQKYQFGNPLLLADHERRGKVNTWVNQGVNQVGMLAKKAEDEARQFREADVRVNKRTKAPMLPNNLVKLQDQLWKIGAFKGIKDRRGREAIYSTAVDGIEGNMTSAAIANAEKMGYTIGNNGTLQQPKQLVKPQTRRNGLAEMYGMTHAAATGGMSTVPGAISAKEDILHNYVLSNMYPYSYGDVIVKGNEVRPYEGGEVPKGWRLRLTTANDPYVVQANSMYHKVRAAFSGKDPRRAFIDELALIDLSTPEGKKKYLEMVRNAPQGVIRIKGNPENDLFEIKSRLDLTNRYDKGTDLTMWEENTDYSSPTARSVGLKTYRIKDPKQRERIYGEMINYFLQNKHKGHWNDEHTAYILPTMGFLGNHSMIADDENGLNLRYGDWWDYKPNTLGGNITYIGDRLVAQGTYPKRTRYGIGHNTDEMTESSENLIKGAIKESLGMDPNEGFRQGFAKMFGI